MFSQYWAIMSHSRSSYASNSSPDMTKNQVYGWTCEWIENPQGPLVSNDEKNGPTP